MRKLRQKHQSEGGFQNGRVHFAVPAGTVYAVGALKCQQRKAQHGKLLDDQQSQKKTCRIIAQGQAQQKCCLRQLVGEGIQYLAELRLLMELSCDDTVKKIGYSGYPRFNSPYELADAEVAAGFNVILHATNHTTDKGKEAVLNCMNYWDTNYPDVAYLGINKTQEEQDNNIYVFEQNGIKVAILNYTYTLNGNRMPKDMPWLVNLMKKGESEKKIIADIKKAEEIADFTILCPHWGTEYSLTVSSTQKYWTEIFLENGVDLVIGAHPHVIEPIEWVSDDKGNKMLVYYSLGNFVNGTSSEGSGVTNRMVGGIADVTIGRNEAGEVVILENGVIPIVCHIGEGDAYFNDCGTCISHFANIFFSLFKSGVACGQKA